MQSLQATWREARGERKEERGKRREYGEEREKMRERREDRQRFTLTPAQSPATTRASMYAS